MGGQERADSSVAWGRAELAAIDRCLSSPSLTETLLPPVRLNRLSRTIETEIIPRLMLAHRADANAVEAEDLEKPSIADVAELAGFAISRDLLFVRQHVESLMGRGHSLETVLLDLLAPAARLLGDMWQDDLCDFAEVTIGLSQLQQVLRSLSLGCEPVQVSDGCGRILLASFPGEQHSFGVMMLEGFFRRAGWEVAGGPGSSPVELCELVRDEWFDAVGISVSCDASFVQLRPTIQELRGASSNPSLFVMVGGRFFLEHPGRATEVGADAAASDAPDALRRAQACLGHTIARC